MSVFAADTNALPDANRSVVQGTGSKKWWSTITLPLAPLQSARWLSVSDFPMQQFKISASCKCRREFESGRLVFWNQGGCMNMVRRGEASNTPRVEMDLFLKRKKKTNNPVFTSQRRSVSCVSALSPSFLVLSLNTRNTIQIPAGVCLYFTRWAVNKWCSRERSFF